MHSKEKPKIKLNRKHNFKTPNLNACVEYDISFNKQTLLRKLKTKAKTTLNENEMNSNYKLFTFKVFLRI